MNKDLMKRLCTFALSLAVIFGAACLYYGSRASALEASLGQQSERALAAMTARLDSLDAALRKTAYVPDGAMRGLLAAEIWRQSEGAKAALSVLPLSDAHLEQYENWLSQTGGYAWTLLRSGLYGTADDAAGDNLATCARVCASVRTQLSDLKERFDAGDAAFTAPARGQGSAVAVSSVFSDTEEAFPDFEPLNYDGPFSAHLLRQTPRGTEGEATYGAEQARAAAASLLGLDVNALSLAYEGNGALPFFAFSGGDGLTVRITKAGGRLLSLTDERAPETASLTAEQAVARGTEWLVAHGFPAVTPGYARTEGGVASLRYYAAQDGAVLYPDLISLGVALDDGSVVRLDATGYWMNHTERTPPADDRSGTPPASLTVLSSRLAVIPTAGQNERWCREYLCESADGRALCYVGCDSGEVEELLLLDETGGGILVR